MANITLGMILHTAGIEPIGTTAGAMHVQLNANLGAGVTFQNAAVGTGDGTAFIVAGYKHLLVDIDWTVTSATIKFMGIGPGGVARSIMGSRAIDLFGAVSATGASESWAFDIMGFTVIYMRIDAIVVGAGSVTVKGRAVP